MPRVDGIQVEMENYPHFSAVWQWDDSGGAYVNHTKSIMKTGTDVSFLDDADDYWYFGHSSRYELAVFLLAINGNYGDMTWEYSNGGSWTEFVVPEEYDFSTNGGERFQYLADWSSLSFSDTSPHSATPPDEEYRYWTRVSTASVTTVASITEIYVNPICRYTTPTIVKNYLQFDIDFDATSSPSREQVQEIINRAESRIDYDSHKTWKYGYAEHEDHQFDRYGIRTLHYPIVSLTSFEIWNGNSYEVYDVGRNEEVFDIDELGMIYFSRFFILPARLAVSGPLWRWGYGEFTFPVRVSYIYGRNLDTDYQGGLVREIATKLAAIDILTSNDYTVLLSSGVEHMDMSSKVEQLNKEVEEKLELLKSFTVI